MIPGTPGSGGSPTKGRPTTASALDARPLMQANPGAQTLELAATAHEDARNTPEAVKLLQQAILLDPHNVNLYVDFALISAAHQSNQVGINVVSDGITQQPNAATLYLAEAFCMHNSTSMTKRRLTSKKPTIWIPASHSVPLPKD